MAPVRISLLYPRHLQPSRLTTLMDTVEGICSFSLWAGLPAVSYPEWQGPQPNRRQNPLGEKLANQLW